METYDGISAVGSLMYGEDDVVTEAGALIWDNGQPFIVARGARNLSSALRLMRPVDYASAAAILYRKETFFQVRCKDLFDYWVL